VKEAGAYRAIDFYNGGDPGGVAGGSLGRELAEMLAKAAGNPPKFSGWFEDVLVIDAGFILENQLFDLFFECSYLFEVQAYLALPFARPYERAVERFRGKVGCEEGDGVETECSCCLDCPTQMTMIGFLDGCATGNREGGVVMTDGENSFVYEIVGSAHATDGVVNLRRPIDGDDNVVEEGRYLFCTFMQEKPRGQEGEMNLPVAKKVAESGEIVVEQRFAACENGLSDAKGS
jgi:hypothetical protein